MYTQFVVHTTYTNLNISTWTKIVKQTPNWESVKSSTKFSDSSELNTVKGILSNWINEPPSL